MAASHYPVEQAGHIGDGFWEEMSQRSVCYFILTRDLSWFPPKCGPLNLPRREENVIFRL